MASDSNTSWMDRVWYVKSVNPGNGSFSLNVTTSDMVMLDPKSMTITRQPNPGPIFHRPKSSLSLSHPWGQWTEAQPDWLSGVTSGGDSSFLVIRDSEHQFTCYCTHLQPLVAFRSLRLAFIPLAVGAVFGTLSGAAVGAAAGSPGSGLLVGMATALASSLAT